MAVEVVDDSSRYTSSLRPMLDRMPELTGKEIGMLDEAVVREDTSGGHGSFTLS